MKLRVAVVAVALLACSDVTAPNPFLTGDAEQLEFSAVMAKKQLVVGDTASVIFILRNPTADTVRLQFNSTCQIIAHVQRGDELVYPQPFMCGAALTDITLAPGAERVVPFSFNAITGNELAIWGGPVLTPGSYVAWAELHNGEGRSSAVQFTIRQ